jgi:hypothetical protein
VGSPAGFALASRISDQSLVEPHNLLKRAGVGASAKHALHLVVIGAAPTRCRTFVPTKSPHHLDSSLDVVALAADRQTIIWRLESMC